MIKIQIPQEVYEHLTSIISGSGILDEVIEIKGVLFALKGYYETHTYREDDYYNGTGYTGFDRAKTCLNCEAFNMEEEELSNDFDNSVLERYLLDA